MPYRNPRTPWDVTGPQEYRKARDFRKEEGLKNASLGT